MAAVSAPEARARGLGVVVVGGGGLGSSLQHTLQIDSLYYRLYVDILDSTQQWLT